ncbi:GPI-anchored lorelei-like protein [Medicago truncatula]|uniref:GPI-anchored lorelei-like protein n=2 Tax=Medicago truncatula TaxID=3880 RepID=G7KP52_MEDTR|nr:GPI-anchored lorelei-like protein [Medicago truncatula]
MGSYTFFSSILYFFPPNGVFGSGASSGRALLQAKKPCGINFETQNYTILTSQCKGPQYPPKVCCDAFKQFACPHVDEISDLTTDCSNVMFSYINLYGKYPPGLFANQCKEGKEGLDCENVKITNTTNPSSSVHVAAPHYMLIVSIVGFFGLIFHLF